MEKSELEIEMEMEILWLNDNLEWEDKKLELNRKIFHMNIVQIG